VLISNLRDPPLANPPTAISTDQSSFTTRFFTSFFARLTQWFASAENGIQDLYARVFKGERVETQELCVGDVCVTRDQLAEVFGGSQVGAAGAPENTQSEAPSGSSAPVATKDADTATSTTPSTTTTPPSEDSANELEPAPVDEPGETPPDVAPDVAPPENGVEPLPEPVNDNGISEPLPSTGTE
jgi:hypothetical protein